MFSSPGIAIDDRRPSQTSIEVRLERDYVGTDSIILVYSCGLPDGTQHPGADVMRVDADGNVVEWRCPY